MLLNVVTTESPDGAPVYWAFIYDSFYTGTLENPVPAGGVLLCSLDIPGDVVDVTGFQTIFTKP